MQRVNRRQIEIRAIILGWLGCRLRNPTVIALRALPLCSSMRVPCRRTKYRFHRCRQNVFFVCRAPCGLWRFFRLTLGTSPVQFCEFWKRVPSCIFDSRAVCENILLKLRNHAKQRLQSQAQQSLLTRSWSICNPATASSLYNQLTLETFHHNADTSGYTSASP